MKTEILELRKKEKNGINLNKENVAVEAHFQLLIGLISIKYVNDEANFPTEV